MYTKFDDSSLTDSAIADYVSDPQNWKWVTWPRPCYFYGWFVITKRLSGLNKLSYQERLRCPGLPSLELRLVYTDVIWCYKIVFGLVDLQLDDFFELSPNTHTRGHRYKLIKKHTSVRVRSSFFNRVISVRNYLPPALSVISNLLILLSSWNWFSMSILLSVRICVHVFVHSFIVHFTFSYCFIFVYM